MSSEKRKSVLDRFTEQARSLVARMRSKSYWSILAVLLFLATGAFLARTVVRDWDQIISLHWQLNWTSLVWLAMLHWLALGTLLAAWGVLLRRLANVGNWRSNLRIYSLSLLARRIPLPIWYAGSRLYLYQKVGIAPGIVLSATVLEAVLIALSGALCYVALLPWYTYTQDSRWYLVLILPAALGLALVCSPQVLVNLISRLMSLLKRPPIRSTLERADLVLLTFIYLMTWLLDGVGLYCMVAAVLPSSPALPDVVGVSTISALVSLLMLILPGGFGLKELTMSALLSLWMPMSAGIAVAVLYRLVQTVLEMFWVLVAYWIGSHSSRRAS